MTHVLKSGAAFLIKSVHSVSVQGGKFRKYANFSVENMEERLSTLVAERGAKLDGQVEPRKKIPSGSYKRQCFEKILSEKQEEINNLNWPKLQSETMNAIKNLNNDTFQNLLIQHLSANNQFDSAKNYMNYLEESSKPNFLTLGHYISLCGKNNAETELFTKLEKIPKEYRVTRDLSHLIISGLAQTSRWRDCLTILKHKKQLHYVKSNNLWGIVAQTAFKNHDFSLGIELLEEMYGDNYVPHPAVINEWVNSICQSPPNEKAAKLRIFLNFSRDKELSLQLEAIENLKQVFEKDFKMHSQLVQIKRDDTHCPACKMKLETLQITNEDFKKLQEEMLKVLINGSDVYRNSNPQEVNSFMKFLDTAKPYNLVIDALNVAFIRPSDKQSMLLDVLQYLKKNLKNPRMLLIGRKHMLKWPAMKLIRFKEQVFLTEDISEDDPFLLYSTIAGGPGTYFLSVDMMRNHSFKFSGNEGVKILFNKWKKSHQILLEKENEKITFIKPNRIETRCQGIFDSSHFHVPSLESDLQTLSRSWLCTKNNVLF